jgi:hypothetical protein
MAQAKAYHVALEDKFHIAGSLGSTVLMATLVSPAGSSAKAMKSFVEACVQLPIATLSASLNSQLKPRFSWLEDHVLPILWTVWKGKKRDDQVCGEDERAFSRSCGTLQAAI